MGIMKLEDPANFDQHASTSFDSHTHHQMGFTSTQHAPASQTPRLHPKELQHPAQQQQQRKDSATLAMSMAHSSEEGTADRLEWHHVEGKHHLGSSGEVEVQVAVDTSNATANGTSHKVNLIKTPHGTPESIVKAFSHLTKMMEEKQDAKLKIGNHTQKLMNQSLHTPGIIDHEA